MRGSSGGAAAHQKSPARFSLFSGLLKGSSVPAARRTPNWPRVSKCRHSSSLCATCGPHAEHAQPVFPLSPPHGHASPGQRARRSSPRCNCQQHRAGGSHIPLHPRPHSYGGQRGGRRSAGAERGIQSPNCGFSGQGAPEGGSGRHLPAPAQHVELRLAGRQLACLSCTASCQRQRATRRPAQAAEDGAPGHRIRRLWYCTRRRRSSVIWHGCLAAAEAPLRVRPCNRACHAQPAQRHVHYAELLCAAYQPRSGRTSCATGPTQCQGAWTYYRHKTQKCSQTLSQA